MSTPRRYSRYNAVHLITTTLARFQVVLERDSLRRMYSVNFGFRVRARHRGLEQAPAELDRAHRGLLEKLRTLGTLRPEGTLMHFDAPNCNYSLTLRIEKDWNGHPMLDIGIFGC